jgi:hypothetical protein
MKGKGKGWWGSESQLKMMFISGEKTEEEGGRRDRQT